MAKRKPPPPGPPPSPPEEEPPPGRGGTPAKRPGGESREGAPPPEDLTESQALVFMSESDILRLDSDEEFPPQAVSGERPKLGESQAQPPPEGLTESQALVFMSESDARRLESHEELLPQAVSGERAPEGRPGGEGSFFARKEPRPAAPFRTPFRGPRPAPSPEAGRRVSLALAALFALASAGVSAALVHLVESRRLAEEVAAARDEEKRARDRALGREVTRREALEADLEARSRELAEARRKLEDERQKGEARAMAAEAEGARKAREASLEEARREKEAAAEAAREEREAAVREAEQRAGERAARERLDLERKVRETIERYEALLKEADSRRKAESELARREAKAEILRREALLREKFEAEKEAMEKEKERALAEESKKLEERLRAELAADRGGFIRGPEGGGGGDGEGLDLERSISRHLAGTLGGSVEYKLKVYPHDSEQSRAQNVTNEGIGKLRYEGRFSDERVTVKLVPRVRFDDDGLTFGAQEELDDEARKRPIFTLEEAWVGGRFGAIDAVIGKQIFAFGTADLLNPTDVLNPVDYTDLIDSEKIGVFALDASVHPLDELELRAILIPTFTPSRLPLENERFSPIPPGGIFVEGPGGLLGPIEVARRKIPDGKDALQAAFRISGSVRGWDLSATYVTGFNRLPVLVPENLAAPPFVKLRPEFDRIHMFGGDFATTFDLPLFGEIEAHGEAAQFFTQGGRDDDYLQFVLGTRYTFADPVIGKETNLTLEYAGEVVNGHRTEKDVLSAGAFTRAFKSAVLSRLVWKPMGRLDLSTTFAWIAHGPDSIYLNPEARYEFGAHTKIVAGADILEGTRKSFFGQFDEDDRMYLSLKLTF